MPPAWDGPDIGDVGDDRGSEAGQGALDPGDELRGVPGFEVAFQEEPCQRLVGIGSGPATSVVAVTKHERTLLTRQRDATLVPVAAGPQARDGLVRRQHPGADDAEVDVDQAEPTATGPQQEVVAATQVLEDLVEDPGRRAMRAGWGERAAGSPHTGPQPRMVPFRGEQP